MKTSADLSNLLKETKSQRNIAIIGTSKGCGATSITNFLYKNYGFKPEGELKIQELELGRISLALEDKTFISIDNTKSHFCDKEGAIIVVDITQKNVDTTFTNTLRIVQKYRLNVLWYFNKVDKAIFDMEKQNPEEVYQLFIEKIDQINQAIEQTNDGENEQVEEIEPTKGNVFFGSAVDGWAFSLSNFAEEYSLKLKTESSKLVTKLWGENFYNTNEKTWHTASDNSNVAHRSFSTFIFDPIWKLHLLVRQGSIQQVEDLVKQLGINVDIANKSGRVLLRIVMYSWLNSAKALLSGVQKYILNFNEGLLELNKWQVFSKHLEKINDVNANILFCFGKDTQTGLTLSKVLRKHKNGEKVELLNVFESDLSTGSQLISQAKIIGTYLPYYSSHSVEVSWSEVLEGQVVLLKAENVATGQILSDLKELPFYKSYDLINSDDPSSVDSKNPFSISNYLLGTLEKLNPKVRSVIAQRNELFLSYDEFIETLIKKHEFTKQDASSIITIKNNCIVFNYSKSVNQNKNLAASFDLAITQSTLNGIKIDLESVNEKAVIDNEELVKLLVNEFKTYTQ